MPEKLKSGWTRVAFEDVVRLCRERSSRPAEDGFDRYLGLEHLEPGDLKIRRWGNVADGTTFTNVFRTGQVLFGKRRAYQRKLAVADFDGVCSGDIYVFEPKNDRLLPELLPFICQTDGFFEHAIGTSAGSLSPRTNWKSLASYEFALPPLEEQRRIAKVLQEAKTTVNALRTCRDSVQTLQASLAEAVLGKCEQGFEGRTAGVLSRNWRVEQLGNIADVRFSNVDKKTADDEIPVRLCNYMDVYTNDYIPSNIEFMRASASTREIQRFSIKKGDVLITKDSEEPTDIGVPALVTEELENVLCGYHLAMIRPDVDLVDSRYLWHFLKTRGVKRYLFKMANGVTRFGLTTGAILRLPVALPPLREQKELARRLSMCRDSFTWLSERVSGAAATLRRLMDMLLSLSNQRHE